jgi:hypothetical protein
VTSGEFKKRVWLLRVMLLPVLDTEQPRARTAIEEKAKRPASRMIESSVKRMRC